MEHIDFSAPAELYASKGKGVAKRSMSYHRFDTSAEAIRYAVETLPDDVLYGTVIEVDEERYDAKRIRALYADPNFPLNRAN